jgi:putative FmdB family regulatory protein
VPTYEYRCKACGLDLEVVQSFTDDALTTCEACGGPLRKVFGNVGIAFKGSGFYKNDSRGKSAATATTTDKSSDGGSGSTDKGGAGTDAGSKTTSDGAAAPSTSTPKADTAKASSTTP